MFSSGRDRLFDDDDDDENYDRIIFATICEWMKVYLAGTICIINFKI